MAATSVSAQMFGLQASPGPLPQPSPGLSVPSFSDTNLFFFAPPFSSRSQPPIPLKPGTNLFLGTNYFAIAPYWFSSNLITRPSLPKPGIYSAKPYSAIVIVPGPRPDDSSIVYLGPADSPMVHPIPDLKLIPGENKN
jgi:hypothetical protein